MKQLLVSVYKVPFNFGDWVSFWGYTRNVYPTSYTHIHYAFYNIYIIHSTIYIIHSAYTLDIIRHYTLYILH